MCKSGLRPELPKFGNAANDCFMLEAKALNNCLDLNGFFGGGKQAVFICSKKVRLLHDPEVRYANNALSSPV